jgi:hypothetical protein
VSTYICCTILSGLLIAQCEIKNECGLGRDENDPVGGGATVQQR